MFIKSKCKPFLNYEASESFMGKLLNTFPFKDFSPSHRKKKTNRKDCLLFHKCVICAQRSSQTITTHSASCQNDCIIVWCFSLG